MKKLLIPTLASCLASPANAGLIFTVDGEPQPDAITTTPSDTVELDLELAPGHNCSAWAY